MKCVVFGASGLAGSYVSRRMGKKYEVIEVSGRSGSGVMLDASEFRLVKRLLEQEKPDVVVNCVKRGSTDEAEADRGGAWAANVLVPENLARAQKKLGYKLVQVSSDWVYEGKENEVYAENSLPYPQNFYSFTKAVAEELVRSLCEDFLIIRPESLFGIDAREANLFCRVRNAVGKGNRMRLAEDQFSQPVYAKTLAEFVLRACEKGATGTYNFVGPDYVSRHRLGIMFCEEFGWDPSFLEPVSGGRAIRIPRHLRVDARKAGEMMKIPLLKEQISELKQDVLKWETKTRQRA